MLIAAVGATAQHASPRPARTPHGGAGIVRADGAVGQLRLDRSTAIDVQQFAGAADYSGIGAFRSGGVVPLFLALGYHCRHLKGGGIPTRRDDGTGTRHPRPSGVDCVTIYYVNTRTNRLALFTSRSPRFRTTAGTRPGIRWSNIKDQGHTAQPCLGLLFIDARGASLALSNIGGTAPSGDPPGPIAGGRVFDLELESTRHPLSLECPEW